MVEMKRIGMDYSEIHIDSNMQLLDVLQCDYKRETTNPYLYICTIHLILNKYGYK